MEAKCHHKAAQALAMDYFYDANRQALPAISEKLNLALCDLEVSCKDGEYATRIVRFSECLLGLGADVSSCVKTVLTEEETIPGVNHAVTIIRPLCKGTRADQAPTPWGRPVDHHHLDAGLYK